MDATQSPRIDDKLLKEMFHSLGPEEWRRVSREQELAWWWETNRFCGKCGQPLAPHPDPNEHAMCCAACGFRSYPKVMPAVITVITRRLPGRPEEILLQRNAHYGLPYWTLVAGFVDPGETFEDAVVREAKEESGVLVHNLRYFGSQIWPFPSNIMVAFFCEWKEGELHPDGDEVVESGWFDRDHLPPLPRKGSIARSMVDAWIDLIKTGTVPN